MRHPAIANVVKRASSEPGFAVEEGIRHKDKRYPPAHGKCVVGCSMESWGRLGCVVDNLLLELHGLAQRRQRDRGINPTNWLIRWRTLMSVHLAMNAGRAIFDSVSHQDKINLFHLCQSHNSDLNSGLIVFSDVVVTVPCDRENLYPGSGRLNTLTHD